MCLCMEYHQAIKCIELHELEEGESECNQVPYLLIPSQLWIHCAAHTATFFILIHSFVLYKFLIHGVFKMHVKLYSVTTINHYVLSKCRDVLCYFKHLSNFISSFTTFLQMCNILIHLRTVASMNAVLKVGDQHITYLKYLKSSLKNHAFVQ